MDLAAIDREEREESTIRDERDGDRNLNPIQAHFLAGERAVLKPESRDIVSICQHITFTAVATRAKLSRSTLYRNPALRAVVEHHRRDTNDGTISALTDEITTLRTAGNTLAARVRTHDEQLRRLTRN